MSEHIMLLLWLGVMGFVATQKSCKRYEYINGQIALRFRPWFAIAMFFPIVWMAGHRTLWFGDTGSYHDKFYAMPSTIFQIPHFLRYVTKDKGFYGFSALIKCIVGADHTMYFLVLAGIQGACLVYVYRKYSLDYVFSIALFVLSTDYIGWMYNGIRQFMAVTVIFAATTLMLQRKYVSVIVIILIASLFHQSALVMLPFVFIAQGKAWNGRTLFFISLAVLAVMFVGEFTDLLDATLEETQYANVVSDFREIEDDGTNPLRVLVYSVPTILAFMGRKTIRKSEEQLIHFCTNMSIISTAMYVVSMFTSGVFLGRIPIYASLYNYILLPWEIRYLFANRTRRFAYAMILACYFLYYYFQMHFQWGFI